MQFEKYVVGWACNRDRVHLCANISLKSLCRDLFYLLLLCALSASLRREPESGKRRLFVIITAQEEQWIKVNKTARALHFRVVVGHGDGVHIHAP